MKHWLVTKDCGVGVRCVKMLVQHRLIRLQGYKGGYTMRRNARESSMEDIWSNCGAQECIERS